MISAMSDAEWYFPTWFVEYIPPVDKIVIVNTDKFKN